MKKEHLVVIDGHALIHRAYHAIPPLTTKNGEIVNAVYGFTVILLNVLKELDPEFVVVAYDLPGKTKRHESYTKYKANRKERPEDLGQQIERTKDIISAFNIPLLSMEGYEADDVIGTIVKNVPKNIESYIVTGDMDELQLVDEKTKVYTMRRGFTDTIIYDEKKVRERYNLPPKQLVDFRALKGDPSDNIPGVSGIGEKTATELIGRYQTLNNVYRNLKDIKPAIAKRLKKDKDKAYLSQKLSRIETNLDINLDLGKCCLAEYDKNEVTKIFTELGFKSLFDKIPKSNGSSNQREHLKNAKYTQVTNKKDLETLTKKLAKSNKFAIDTETTSKNQMIAKLVGISFAINEGEAFYLPLRHNSGKQLPIDIVKKALNPILSSKKIGKIGHNLKYDYVILKRAGFQLTNITFDTMVAAYLLNPTVRGQKLKNLAQTELGIRMTEIEELIGTGKEQITFDKIEVQKATIYACEDADMTLRLSNKLQKELISSELLTLAKKIEFPLIPILAEMELTGIRVDKEKLNLLSKITTQKISKIEKKIYETAGEEFNIASPIQLQKILFEKLKIHEQLQDLKELKKLKGGKYSTAAPELEKLRGHHPIINDIIEYRELSKLKNTYIDVLPKLINKETKRIHTTFNQTVTQTGRLSSTDPNLQNIPTRTEMGKKIREAFISNDSTKIVSADYSQIELRVIAHIAKDQEMIKVFKEERDIHTETAAKLYSVPEDKVAKSMRRAAKIVNFGIIYGVSAHGLREQVGVSREEGQKLIDRYFDIHPQVKKYTEDIIKQAKEVGYVETIFGRRRYLPEINSKNFAVRGAAERMAINMPVQGTAADLIKLAMIDIANSLPKKFPNAKLLLQIHDELVFEVPTKEAKELAVFVEEKMNHIINLSVPIKTKISIGNNWGELK